VNTTGRIYALFFIFETKTLLKSILQKILANFIGVNKA